MDPYILGRMAGGEAKLTPAAGVGDLVEQLLPYMSDRDAAMVRAVVMEGRSKASVARSMGVSPPHMGERLRRVIGRAGRRRQNADEDERIRRLLPHMTGKNAAIVEQVVLQRRSKASVGRQWGVNRSVIVERVRRAIRNAEVCATLFERVKGRLSGQASDVALLRLAAGWTFDEIDRTMGWGRSRARRIYQRHVQPMAGGPKFQNNR